MMLQQQNFPVVILMNEVFGVFCSRDNKFFVKMKILFYSVSGYFQKGWVVEAGRGQGAV